MEINRDALAARKEREKGGGINTDAEANSPDIYPENCLHLSLRRVILLSVCLRKP